MLKLDLFWFMNYISVNCTVTIFELLTWWLIWNASHLLQDRLPFSIRVLLESAVRNCDGFLVKRSDVESILNWKQTQTQSVEVPFRPARVILQDFTWVRPHGVSILQVCSWEIFNGKICHGTICIVNWEKLMGRYPNWGGFSFPF